jgi:hypothetical protein
MLRAAIAALSISSVSTAHADDSGDAGPNPYFTLLPRVSAQAPQQLIVIAKAQGCQAERQLPRKAELLST